MVLFPNGKINIGLNILRKREDGYHDIETCFYPIGLKDALEFVVNGKNGVNFESSGLELGIHPEQNIVLKAYRLMSEEYTLPGLDIHLHKVIPFGAGLGGGSSDAAFFLKSLNEHFELNISPGKLKAMAGRLGADCSFFLENKPAYATGTGEKLVPLKLSLEGHFLLLVKPPFGVETKEAYAGVVPQRYPHHFIEILEGEMKNWNPKIKNDFETTLFPKFPLLSLIKSKLEEMGAKYASMSGSGSAIYAFFGEEPVVNDKEFPPGSFIWMEQLP
jgi:4-diphosphocytidyl-2-C-methyl-D-erythritol kinase